MRVDVWDVGKDAIDVKALDCGYPRDFDRVFFVSVDGVVGKGGFGEVRCAHGARQLARPVTIIGVYLEGADGAAILHT
jgi:hypothetical protein